MGVRPFWFTDTISVAANGSTTAVIPISEGETMRLRRVQFISTSTFNITGLKDASGNPFSNASASDPIPSTTLNNAATNFSGISNFNPPLEIKGPGSLNFDILDTSGSTNTVRVVIEGEKET